MIDPSTGYERSVSEEAAEPAPRGTALWEMALGGRGWDDVSPTSRPPTGPTPTGTGGRRVGVWMGAAAGVLVLGVVVGWLATTGGTADAPANPGVVGSTGPVAPAPSAAPGAESGPSCSAQPVVATPAVGTTTSIMVTGAPSGSAITVDLTYPGGTARYSVPADRSGVSYVPITVGGMPVATAVQVSVTAGTSSCRTSFTPAAPGPG